MATSSISGLASGLDTAGIIDQLMKLESVPQTKLRDQQTAENNVIKALRQLNTDTALLASNAAKLAKTDTWQTLKATSSSSAVTATASPTASASSFTVVVGQLAKAAQTTYGKDVALNTDVRTVAGDPVVLTAADGTTRTIDVGTGSLKDLAAGINAAKAGVTATTVRTGATTYRLLLTADATGAGSAISLTNVDLGTATTDAGQDAQLTIGGIAASSKSNTFTDLVPGVTVTLAATAKNGDTSTVSVAQDSSGVKTSVKALVDQVNALLTSIDTQTAAKTSTSPAGVLAGDPTARSLRTALLNTVFGDDTTSLAPYGIQTDRYGKLVFDADKFAAAYAADPAGVAAKFTSGATSATDGWAARVATVTKSATDTYTGTITNAITGHTTTVDRLSKSITDWDGRLELRRSTLERQYTALETALSSLQSQSSWLAGQINSLPSHGS
ncbi:flagellar filament capping protein FliD [Nocardioides aquiterrae]|uniref:Flagellar hook-associated protein 2 n=1 Tax=Nocardioides aquiterrae TaxID=203799 RepID=A0ABN1UBW5_9ACTN